MLPSKPQVGDKDWGNPLNLFLMSLPYKEVDATDLIEGNLYYDSTLNTIRVWSGTEWKLTSPVVAAIEPAQEEILPQYSQWIDVSTNPPKSKILIGNYWVDIVSGEQTARTLPTSPSPSPGPNPDPDPTPDPGPTPTVDYLSSFGDSKILSNTDTLADLQTRQNALVSDSGVTFVVGFTQNTSINQNPQVARFDNDVLTWHSNNAYESGGADSQAVGLLWDKADDLYVAFTIDGEQSDSLSRFTSGGWINGYGMGGGAKVSVLAKIDVNTGAITHGTYLRAELSNGNTNSLEIKDLSINAEGNIVVRADTFSVPLKTDKSRFSCTGGSPFDYTVELSPDLSTAISASATGCS